MSNSIGNLESLSKPELLEALSKTGLVREYKDGDDGIGLLISSGKITPFNSDGWPSSSPFPSELLTGPVTSEAHEILLSKNRIVLDGKPSESLAFLTRLPGDAVTHIRAIDICFSKQFIDDWISGSPASQEWKELATFITTKLQVEEVDLVLDAGIAFEIYQEQRYTEDIMGDVKDAYGAIVDVLVTALNGKKPKSFMVFWAAFHDSEKVAEKKVMGDDYDSVKLGKVPSTRRNPYFPHGEKEWEDGISL